MFINIKLKNVLKYFFVIIIILMIIFFGISTLNIYNKSKAITNNSQSEIIEITPNNYTNVLKAVHENIDLYIGKKIKCTGYIYRIYDFNNSQFVLARNMIINTNNQAVVVGFLCNYNNIINFKDNSWVEIRGVITKGNYHGTIPIIEIDELKEVDCPTDEFVYPPDDSFIPTNSIL